MVISFTDIFLQDMNRMFLGLPSRSPYFSRWRNRAGHLLGPLSVYNTKSTNHQYYCAPSAPRSMHTSHRDLF